MKMFVWNLLLALLWAVITVQFTPGNFLVGFALGYAALWIASGGGRRTRYFSKLPKAVGFAGYFLWELLLANLRVAYDVVTPKAHMRPGVVGVPLDVRGDVEITLLANLITLTPGTLSLDVSDDRRTLYLHVMYLDDPDALRRQIKDGFERRVMELLR